MRKLNSNQIKDLSTLLVPGKGVTYNTSSGLLTSKISSENFNSYIDGFQSYYVTGNSDPALSFSAGTTYRFIIRSIHITNISSNTSYLSGSINYANGNTAGFANLTPFASGSSAEFIQRPQIIQPGDTIYLQGFDKTLTRANGLLSATFTYETITDDASYVGTGTNLGNSNTSVAVVTATGSGYVIESVKAINLLSETVTVQAFIANSTVIPKSYYTYNLSIPRNSSVELLQATKYLNINDSLYVNYVSPFGSRNGVSVLASYRQTDYATPVYVPTVTDIGNVSNYVTFTTNIADTTVLYYTIEEYP